MAPTEETMEYGPYYIRIRFKKIDIEQYDLWNLSF